MLGRLKLLGPLSESLLLPFELFVSSFLIIVKNIIHQAELYLNLVELDVVILNHRVLLFEVQNILAKQLEEDLLAQNVVILPNGEFFLKQVGEHGQKEGLATILLFLE